MFKLDYSLILADLLIKANILEAKRCLSVFTFSQRHFFGEYGNEYSNDKFLSS
jgi:hypothetical protein